MRPENFENYSSDLRAEGARTLPWPRQRLPWTRSGNSFRSLKARYGSMTLASPTRQAGASWSGPSSPDLEIIAELQRRFAPLSREQSRRHIPWSFAYLFFSAVREEAITGRLVRGVISLKNGHDLALCGPADEN